MEVEKLKLWMPISKELDGSYSAILSDTSIDRDEEMMGKECIEDWARNKSLPALMQHENKMKSWVGGWTDFRTISKNDNTALLAKPKFFSKEANPDADMLKKQVDEALEMGLNPGISIGAIPKEHIEKEIDGKTYKVYTKAELVEASWVPIQSNRNSSYGHIAKSFDLSKKKKAYDKDGAHAHTEEGPLGIHNHPEIESNLRSSIDWMNERIDNLREVVNGLNNPCEENTLRSNKNYKTEVNKMAEKDNETPEGEAKPEETPEEGKPSEEKPEETPTGEEKVEGQEEVDAAKEVTDLKLKVTELEKKLDEVLKKAVMANTPTIEKAEVTKTDKPLTVEKMLELKSGGK